jgi:hypothetical protein
MTAPNLQEIYEYGVDARRGNLLGIQPYVTAADYASAGALLTKLTGYCQLAQRCGWLTPKTIIIFPEHIATWLALAGEWPWVYRAPRLSRVLLGVVLHRPVAFLRAWLLAWGASRTYDALLRMKARSMASDYQFVFGTLARHYGVTVVAGSIVLPAPRVERNVLVTTPGALYNVCAVFEPSGAPYRSLIRKLFPTKEEQSFIEPGLPGIDQPVFVTPAGRLGVLICADSWYPQSYMALRAQGAEMLAVPAFLTGNSSWQQPWAGYNGGAMPPDVALADVMQISEGVAWQRYAMPRRLTSAGIAHGLTLFLRGRLWELGADGRALLVRHGELHTPPAEEGAALVNLWL